AAANTRRVPLSFPNPSPFPDQQQQQQQPPSSSIWVRNWSTDNFQGVYSMDFKEDNGDDSGLIQNFKYYLRLLGMEWKASERNRCSSTYDSTSNLFALKSLSVSKPEDRNPILMKNRAN
ncbi:hypothetical protein LINPERHAP2_LOCUS21691, partial [Linum perenne]